jgi:FkbM family methyltransferase
VRFFVLGLIAIGAAAFLIGRRPVAPLAKKPPETVKVLEVPQRGDVELWKTELGRVVVRAAEPRPHFHRHAHATWLGESGEIWYAPPYSVWKSDGPMVGFIAAPQDEPTYAAEAPEAAKVVRIDGEQKWMLEKLERIVVPARQQLGPYAREIVVYVIAGQGEVNAHAISARQLASIAAGTMIEIDAKSPLTLLVFDPAKTTVSPILKEGQKLYSQDDEELVIRDFFRDRRGGFFLDVGAGHWQRDSTTLYLEERLGWSGVAIDALAEYAEDYRRHRPRTAFVNRLITDKARGPQKFYRAESYPEVSSVSKQLAEKQSRELADGGAVRELEVATSTLDEVLDGQGVKAIDFLSMDIEEHEPAALAGFDIERFHPAFVCVEAHAPVRDLLWRYFRRHGYVRQDQYLAWDSANWYFAPR